MLHWKPSLVLLVAAMQRRGLLAAHGIQSVVREAVTARLNADSVEVAAERVRAAIGSEPYVLDRAEPE